MPEKRAVTGPATPASGAGSRAGGKKRTVKAAAEEAPGKATPAARRGAAKKQASARAKPAAKTEARKRPTKAAASGKAAAPAEPVRRTRRGYAPGEGSAWSTAAKGYVSVFIRDEVKARARNAAAFVQNVPGQPASFSELVDHAIDEFVSELESRYNDGEPFPEGKPRRGPAPDVMAQVAFIREAKRREVEHAAKKVRRR